MYLMVRHKVRDFDAWKKAFDSGEANRQAAGSRGAHLFRGADNPNEVVVTFTWDDDRIGEARAYMASAALREGMQEAGVIDQPDVYLLNDAGRTSG
jgi:hypothetical protein